MHGAIGIHRHVFRIRGGPSDILAHGLRRHGCGKLRGLAFLDRQHAVGDAVTGNRHRFDIADRHVLHIGGDHRIEGDLVDVRSDAHRRGAVEVADFNGTAISGDGGRAVEEALRVEGETVHVARDFLAVLPHLQTKIDILLVACVAEVDVVRERHHGVVRAGCELARGNGQLAGIVGQQRIAVGVGLQPVQTTLNLGMGSIELLDAQVGHVCAGAVGEAGRGHRGGAVGNVFRLNGHRVLVGFRCALGGKADDLRAVAGNLEVRDAFRQCGAHNDLLQSALRGLHLGHHSAVGGQAERRALVGRVFHSDVVVSAFPSAGMHVGDTAIQCGGTLGAIGPIERRAVLEAEIGGRVVGGRVIVRSAHLVQHELVPGVVELAARGGDLDGVLAGFQALERQHAATLVAPLHGAARNRLLAGDGHVADALAVDGDLVGAGHTFIASDYLKTIITIGRHGHGPGGGAFGVRIVAAADPTVAGGDQVSPAALVRLHIRNRGVVQLGVLGLDGRCPTAAFRSLAVRIGGVGGECAVLVRGDDQLIAGVTVDAGGRHIQRAGGDVGVADHVDHARRGGCAVDAGIGVLANLYIHVGAQHVLDLIKSGHVHGDGDVVADPAHVAAGDLAVGAAVQHGGLLVRLVDRGDALQIVDGVLI